MIRRMALLLLPLGLTACLGACLGAGEAADPGAQDACGAAAMQGLVGRPLTAFDSAALTVPWRILRPGTAVTMDFNPARLNVTVDEADAITRVGCG